MVSPSFDNQGLRLLPTADTDQNEAAETKGVVFHRVPLAPLPSPELILWSEEVLRSVGVSAPVEGNRQSLAALLSASAPFPGADYTAHCYCGFQFGYFSGQLGDGAAMSAGEVVHEGRRLELAFKGSGPTPYRRTADGRKVLRSSLREFLCSEHMHALGIPTTRAGSLVGASESVIRDQFYTGNPKPERCCVVTRVARSFLRFGSFEVCRGVDAVTRRSGPSACDLALLCRLVDYTAKALYSDIHEDHGRPDIASVGLVTAAGQGGAAAIAQGGAAGNQASMHREDSDTDDGDDDVSSDAHGPVGWVSHVGKCPYPPALVDRVRAAMEGTSVSACVGAVLQEVVRRTARLVAAWQLVGFCHGVLNTDNMSILGITLDYGPFGFLDRFDRNHVCNMSDEGGRYSYANQPTVCRWNCARLAEAWWPLLPGGTQWIAHTLRRCFDEEFSSCMLRGMRQKLGLLAEDGSATGCEAHSQLFAALWDTMERSGADMTRTFRALMQFKLRPGEGSAAGAATQASAAARVAAAAAAGAIREGDTGPSAASAAAGAESPPSDDLSAIFEQIKGQLSSAGEVASALRPSGMPRRQATMLLQLAEAGDERLAGHAEELRRLVQGWEAHDAFATLAEEAKRERDEAEWLAWLRQFRAALLADRERATAQHQSAARCDEHPPQPFDWQVRRHKAMAAANPRFVLRNWVAQKAVDLAQSADGRQELWLLFRQMTSPFASIADGSGGGDFGLATELSGLAALDGRPPPWACKLRVSCSS